jgi:hypothetical protein
MSFKFSIKNTSGKAVKEGEAIVRFSGTGEPFNRHSERAVKKVGIDGAGNPRLVFTTGLDEKAVQFYVWYSEDEKKLIRETITELKQIITDYYGGEEVVAPNNAFFWKDDRNVNRLSLRHDTMDMLFDTENPTHALLYLSIISGAFIDLVAPTKDWADRHYIPHYLALESEGFVDDDDEITRSDAHAALGDLRKNHGKEALYILAWCLQYDTNAYGAYNYNTPERDLVNYHIKYIDGKLVTKKKRNTAKQFLEYYEKWNKQQTRKALYTEAYVKAGEYYNFVNQREKKYTTYDGTALGNTIDDAVTALLTKPKLHPDYEKLREQVEAKWKE